MRSKITFSLVLICLFAVTAFAQTVKLENGRLSPRLLNYQGYLTDTLGDPITNPSVSMIFSIFDAASSGNQKWTETQGTVSIEKGIFHVILGSVAAIPDSVFTNGSDRWLELSIAGQTLAPRTQIVSVPYSYTATYSDTALYARNSAPDFDWNFLISDGADTTLQIGGRWGLARAGNVLYGNADSTHVNFGVACTTGSAGMNYKYCTVGGGRGNTASGNLGATVAGGISNSVTSQYSSVGGGFRNNASASVSTIAGGSNNSATSAQATVCGGMNNTASGLNSFVGGGPYNYAGGFCAVTGGGYYDSVNAVYGGVLSGYGNLAGDEAADTGATVCGGFDNAAIGKYSFIGGGMSDTANGPYATVAGGYSNYAGGGNASTVAGGYNNSAGWPYSFVGGGMGNTVTNQYAAIAGGNNNSAASYSSVAGGTNNSASGGWSAIAGGFNNTASGVRSFVGGGTGNTASGGHSTVVNGNYNSSAGDYSTVVGGIQNIANANFAIIVGGDTNYNAGTYSAILGGYADTITATADYSYLFGINSNLTQDSTFLVDLPHIRFGTEATGYEFPIGDGSIGQYLQTNGSGQLSWSTVAGGDTDWVISGNNQYSGVSGNVGIGTSNPLVKLDVNGVICGGAADTVMGTYGAVLGGYSNLAGDEAADTGATVCGGYDNTALSKFCFVGGGALDTARGFYSTVTGGYNNTASNNYAFVGGGNNNTASALYAIVCGGWNNVASINYATVCGGQQNTADSLHSTVAGGYLNTAHGRYSFVGGGYSNVANRERTTISGGFTNATAEFGATIGGGEGNAAMGRWSTIAGGVGNDVSQVSSAVGGGYMNNASGFCSTVGGGQYNLSSDWFSTIAGGFNDTIAGYCGFGTNYHTMIYTSDSNSAAFTTSHTTSDNQVRAAAFSTGILCFTMDHPRDPMNKILNQYAVGSDGAMLMYTGTAVIDAHGRASVSLPDYFADVSRNPRIQLTGVGTYEIYVAEKISGNKFAIGGKPGTEVYWTVTAERTDVQAEIAYAKTPVEQEKTGNLKGHSLDDDALIGIYDGLQKDQPGKFSFKTEEGRQANEQIKHPPRIPEQGNK